jgi:hypothetical protein
LTIANTKTLTVTGDATISATPYTPSGTDVAVADGGTGASTAVAGLNNLLPSQTGNANKFLQTDATNPSWQAVDLTTDITGVLPVANGGTGASSGWIFGAWASKSNDTVYQAETDGFVMTTGSAAGLEMYVYTDSSNPPTTSRGFGGGSVGNHYDTITMPVRKNDYWKVTGAITVYWLPIGS